MATATAPALAPGSSSSAQEQSIPAAPLPSRKIPGPWTHEETIHLIDAYQEKWYSLRRGQLKASHWEEVAEMVGIRCGHQKPSKTSTQCRHKVEKLRKRYRTEKQKGFTDGSSWIYYQKMDILENGPVVEARARARAEPVKDDSDTSENDCNNNNTGSLRRLMGNGGFRVRSETRPSHSSFRLKSDRVEPEPYPRGFRSCSSSRSAFKRSSSSGGGKLDPIAELAPAIRCLGEGFMKMEQMKMEMMRETESMRMEMEMKRTEMILETQQRIADGFMKAFYAKKKMKRMPSPDS